MLGWVLWRICFKHLCTVLFFVLFDVAVGLGLLRLAFVKKLRWRQTSVWRPRLPVGTQSSLLNLERLHAIFLLLVCTLIRGGRQAPIASDAFNKQLGWLLQGRHCPSRRVSKQLKYSSFFH